MESQFPKWPEFTSKEVEIASSILKSGKVNYWTGNEGKHFEKEYANYCNTKYSIALANGSVALTAAYKSIGVQKGDEIIMSSRTFIATASSAVILGAIPIFADVEKDSGNISAERIEALITKKTKAIVAVHLGGWPADMHKINAIAKEYKLYVIEDCAQAHGAQINGVSVGSFGNAAAWSFCQDKIMTTAGEGGMITTSSQKIWNYIWSYKDHGKDFNTVFKKKHPPGYRWLHESFGTNYRMTEIQSGIGRYQLSQLKKWNKIRTNNAGILANSLQEISSVHVPLPPKNIKHAWYKFYLHIDKESFLEDWSRDRIVDEISKKGFPIFTGSCSEIYMENCFKSANLRPDNRLPVAQELGEISIMLLVHPTIKEEKMHQYADLVKSYLKKAKK
tara:strand:+ start:31548 stop:32720 length:1173 start_codon:yes stop_codon:yes gene_type:complete